MPNSVDKSCDLIIIGGGLTGLSHAILAGKDGLDVLLIEKNDYPKHKVCGEYISMESIGFLKKLGLPVDELHLPLISEFTLTSQHGSSSSCRLDSGGIGISRYKLDKMLFEIAKNNGAQVTTGQKVTGIEFDASTLRYLVSVGNQQSYSAKMVIGSYGRISGLDDKKQKDNHSEEYVGVKYHVSQGPKDNTIEIHNFNGGYCGISRIEDEKYCLCYLTKANALRQYKGDLQLFENEVLKKNPFLKVRLETKILEGPITTSQFRFGIKKGDHQFLLSGDAAGFIPPITGNGMSLAFRSANDLHPYILQFLKGEISRENLLKANKRYIDQYLNFRIRKGIFLQNLLFIKNPFLSKLLFRVIAGVPGLLKMLSKNATGKPF